MTKKKASKKLTDAQVLEKYPNIKQYLETSKEKKNEWDDALRDVIRDEEGSFTFYGYFVAFKDSSSTWEDGCENVQWIIEVLNDGISEFWQVVGYTSSYDGNQFDDYWYDFKKVTPTEKMVTVWE
jgi:Sec7-like guanine-nucleotide exchange factor